MKQVFNNWSGKPALTSIQGMTTSPLTSYLSLCNSIITCALLKIQSCSGPLCGFWYRSTVPVLLWCSHIHMKNSGERVVMVKRCIFCKVVADLPQVLPVLTRSSGASSHLDPTTLRWANRPLPHREAWEESHPWKRWFYYAPIRPVCLCKRLLKGKLDY